ncbi:phage antirepressor N-terminal domain-containing protein [Aggregatibacter actinomycetemcomitans]|uniref:phage antirepressor N-terminal domain-containing protein n=1 Tax=Aggregatibacter actinomycetemcomitans TaxID=714 RepID=UPI00197C2578|nr:phage antirepressor N-terminal domain-containing protein [Aggregatibacter actinomycetemcomitans]MBN6067319.1 phage antirepressor N-terminal domain-containing protein [Aggregatibacter actinomycetemcomitans]MBN6084863.1 phage antirepressor N-terminal domain-containing protein [Aggregatibacter actinomycetemcomitans]
MEALKAEFLGKEVTLVDNNGIPYVAMREIVEGIGLDWKVQHKKLISQFEKFNCGHITTVAQDGKNRKMLCIPIKKLNGWLFGLNPNKVRSDLKERLENYQEECFLVLWDYWTEGVARRDEVKNKLALWQQKKTEYMQRAGERGKLLQQCKSEKQALERELLQIKQLDLFANL